MNYPQKRDYHDLRRPYPREYRSGFGLPRQTYLRRPQHWLVTLSYEFMRLCGCIALGAIAMMIVIVAAGGRI